MKTCSNSFCKSVPKRPHNLGCKLHFLSSFSIIGIKYLLHMMLEKCTFKIIHRIARILIHSSFCVLNFMLPAESCLHRTKSLWKHGSQEPHYTSNLFAYMCILPSLVINNLPRTAQLISLLIDWRSQLTIACTGFCELSSGSVDFLSLLCNPQAAGQPLQHSGYS
jgi:hypothetical protein